MNICFIMYPWERVVPKQDTTIRMIHECVKRGHTVGIATPANLTIRDSVTYAFTRIIKKMDKVPASMSSFYSKVVFKENMLPLAGFDAIFMRDNPPMDTTVLNFLDSVKDDVFIINDVNGLREANNKIYTASYYDPQYELTPKTYVSKNINYLKKIIEESDAEKMIMKPLNGYGGSGVIVIEKSAAQNISSLLDFYISGKDGETSYVILQEYVPGAEKGDVRVLMLHGEPIGALKRVPKAGEARSNISVGGVAVKYTLTKEDKKLCSRIGKKLVRDGLYFVGLDIIGGKLIEVNVMSPGGMADINKLNGIKLQETIVDYLEETIKFRESHSIRRESFRKSVKDA